MINVGRKEIGIHNFAIRLLGVITMILALIGYVRGYGSESLYAFRFTSFTFFAFLLVEGVFHSSDRVLYIRRFIVFGLLSEVLYDYYHAGKFFSLLYQSAMATLFMCLLVMLLLRLIKRHYDNMVLNIILVVVLGVLCSIIAERYRFEFGMQGVIIVMMFYVARQVHYPRILELIVLFYMVFFMKDNETIRYISVGGLMYPLAAQLYCFIALPFIWMYDDTRGPNSLGLQIAQYLVYPAAMIILLFLK
ncbi:MAG: hypothetical protein IKZ78_05300 [Firmicutes bacterium]|nr:hypothetical protein [Bacillota bacterium]MBR6025871.1 hypothetical protein [Bacillota bacterium]